eukprot:59547-Prymnesium_polylepis.1
MPPPSEPPPTPPPTLPPPPPFLSTQERLEAVAPMASGMLSFLLAFACIAYFVSWRPDFTPKQVSAIKEAWKSDHLMLQMASTKEIDLDTLVESQLGGEKHLSPDYLPVLTPQADSKLLRMRLTQANVDLDDETQARILAAAFMKHPGETLLAGIATVNAARNYAKKLE